MKRPVCLVCIITVVFIVSAYFLGVPLSAKEAASRYLEEKYEFPLDCAVTGRVVSFDILPEYARLTLGNVILNGGDDLENVRITLTETPETEYKKGQVLRVRGKLKIPDAPTNPGQFDARLYYRTLGAGFTMTDPKVTVIDPGSSFIEGFINGARESLKKRITEMYSGDEAGIACAVLTGDREYISGRTGYLYRSGGVSHLLVISSLHLSIISYGIAAMLKKLKVPYIPAAAGTFVILLVFVLFTGSGISAVRALCMYVFLAAAGVIKRTYDMRTTLAVAALLLLFAEPYNLFNSGFQLSFACIAAIAAGEKCGKYSYGVLIYFLTLPLVLYHFFEIPVFGIFLNMLLIPFMPFLILFCITGTVLGGVFALPYRGLVYLFLYVLHKASDIPGSVLVCGRPALWAAAVYYLLAFGLIAVLYKYRYHKRRYFFLPGFVLISLILIVRPQRDLQVSFIDVGQGDSIVIDAPGNFECLIDGGSSSVFNAGKNRILPFLESSGIGSLEYVFVTHGDEDHINGVSEIAEMIRDGETAFKISNIVMPDTKDEGLSALEKKAEEAGIHVIRTKAGDSLIWKHAGSPDVTLEVAGPSDELCRHAQGNEASLVVRLSFGNFNALFTGDAEGAGEQETVSYYKKLQREGRTSDTELLKVAHHGSKNSTGEDLLRAVSPSVAVVSCGKDNIYGHPHEETLSNLKDAGADIFRTDESGAVNVRTDGKRYYVETYSGFGPYS